MGQASKAVHPRPSDRSLCSPLKIDLPLWSDALPAHANARTTAAFALPAPPARRQSVETRRVGNRRRHCAPPQYHHQSSMKAASCPGTVVAGRYRIAGLLGRGGMGEVLPRHTTSLPDQAVALKFLPEPPPPTIAPGPLLQRGAHRPPGHPPQRLPRVYDVGIAEGLHYISMEFVDGEDLGPSLSRIPDACPSDRAGRRPANLRRVGRRPTEKGRPLTATHRNPPM